MSTPNAGLVLHLNFGKIADGKLTDLSGNHNDGTLRGNPQTVGDDTFSSCLSFNGVSDYVELPPDTTTDYSQGVTFEAWVFYTDISALCIFDFGNGEASDNLMLANLVMSNRLNLTVWDSGGPASNLGLSGEHKTNQWVHFAGTISPTGAAVLYVNGEQAAAGTVHPPTRKPRRNNYIGKSGRVRDRDRYFQGKIASARVYKRALSADEIRQDMQEDQTPAASFRASYPLDFKLYDREDNQQVIYITDEPQGHEMSFEVSNTSRKAITLAAPAAAQASADNHHFELRLRAGTLSEAALARLALADSGWSMLKPAPEQAARNGGSVSLYFLSASERTLDPSKKVALTLTGVAADAGAGARGTRAELRFRQMHYPGDPTPLGGTRIQHLNVVNRRGQQPIPLHGEQPIPLHVSFLDSNAVLNDGKTENQLRLRITNFSKNYLNLTPEPSPAASKIVISFDPGGLPGMGNDWALGTDGQLNKISIDAPRWTVLKTETLSPEWILTTTQPSIAPGEAIDLWLKGIVTSHPSGMTNMYVGYENIPGHRDSRFIATIEKAPVIYVRDKVGVGTNDPQGKLQVTGGAIMPTQGNTESSGIMFPKDLGTGDAAWIRYFTRMGRTTTLELGTGNEDANISLMPSGNVGVGTIRPRARLTVVGSLSMSTDESLGGIMQRIFEGQLKDGQVVNLDLYNMNAGPHSSHLELLVLMHDTTFNVYRLYQKGEYACYRQTDTPPTIELLAQAYRKVYGFQDIYKAEVVADGVTIRVRLSQSGGGTTNSAYQIVVNYMVPGV